MDPELEPTADEADVLEQHEEQWSEGEDAVDFGEPSGDDADRVEPLDEESVDPH